MMRAALFLAAALLACVPPGLVPRGTAAADSLVVQIPQTEPEWRVATKLFFGGKGHGGHHVPLTHYLLLNSGGTGSNRIILNGGGLLLCNAC